MSKFLRHDAGKDYNLYNFSDGHEGSKGFHEEAFESALDMVEADPLALVTYHGDMIEGKTIDSPHFNPDGLKVGLLDIHSQCKSFANRMKRIKNKIIMIQKGNHELYLDKNFKVVEYMCELIMGERDAPSILGDYQTWVKINDAFTLHSWHGRPTMPRGAKDPIQREANQMAWLKNKLHGLAGSAQVQYMAHTHQCLVVKPIQQYALLDSGENVRGRYFTESVRDIGGETWVPPDARWYVNTGTFRRSGGFDYEDYAEVAGYVPAAIAFTKTIVRNNRIVDIEKVVM